MKGFSPELRKDAIFAGFSSRNAYLELHNRASKMQSSQGLVRVSLIAQQCFEDVIFARLSSRNAYLELHNRASKMRSSLGLVRGTRILNCTAVLRRCSLRKA